MIPTIAGTRLILPLYTTIAHTKKNLNMGVVKCVRDLGGTTLLVIAITLLLTVPTLVLIDEIYSHVIPNLDDCCQLPASNATLAVCIVQRGQLDTVFGTIFLSVLWVGFFFTLACASLVLHWRMVEYRKKGRAMSPVLVSILGTVAIFTLVLSFGAATFIVKLSTSGFYDCDPFTDQLLLQNGWIQCLASAVVTVVLILKMRVLYPTRTNYTDIHKQLPQQRPQQRQPNPTSRTFSISNDEMDGSDEDA